MADRCTYWRSCWVQYWRPSSWPSASDTRLWPLLTSTATSPWKWQGSETCAHLHRWTFGNMATQRWVFAECHLLQMDGMWIILMHKRLPVEIMGTCRFYGVATKKLQINRYSEMDIFVWLLFPAEKKKLASKVQLLKNILGGGGGFMLCKIDCTTKCIEVGFCWSFFEAVRLCDL